MGFAGVFFDVSLYGYLLALLIYATWFFWRDRRLWLAGSILLGLSLASQVAYMIARGAASGIPPLTDTFETLVFFAACVAAFFLVGVWAYGWRQLAPLAAFAALFLTLFAHLIAPEEIKACPLALQNSFWLTVHVVLCFVSYAAFLIAYVGALGCLVKDERHSAAAALAVALTVSGILAGLIVVLLSRSETWPRSRGAILVGAAGGAMILAAALWPLLGWAAKKLRILERLPEKAALEGVVYKTIAFGFPFLTLGIMTGAIWANQAWGRYWGWDKKEVAALVTWIVYAAYLHVRLVPRWRGAWIAWIAVIGFWCVLFTYFGINYLTSSIHAYA